MRRTWGGQPGRLGRATGAQGVSSAAGQTQVPPQGQWETEAAGDTGAGGQAAANGSDANPAGDIRRGVFAVQLWLPARGEGTRCHTRPDAGVAIWRTQLRGRSRS